MAIYSFATLRVDVSFNGFAHPDPMWRRSQRCMAITHSQNCVGFNGVAHPDPMWRRSQRCWSLLRVAARCPLILSRKFFDSTVAVPLHRRWRRLLSSDAPDGRL